MGGRMRARKVNPRKARIRVISDLLKGVDNPKVCHQCVNPPCMKACPKGAIEFNKILKIPVIIEDRCIGCKACVEACPFGEMFFDQERNVALKVTLNASSSAERFPTLAAPHFPTSRNSGNMLLAAGNPLWALSIDISSKPIDAFR
jgi:Fe-S-cluster-containing hydrogenase component 2